MPDTPPILTTLAHLRETEGDGVVFDEAGILADDQQRSANTATLAIKVLSVFGGLLACAAFLGFLGFLGLAGLFDSPSGMLIVGGGGVVAALALGHVSGRLILDTVSIALFAIGLSLIAFALESTHWETNAICLAMIALSAISLVASRAYALAFLSALLINLMLLVLISHNVRYTWIHVYSSGMAILLAFWILQEAAIITTGPAWLRTALTRLYNPVRIALMFSFLTGLVFLGIRGLFPVTYVWVSSITTILAVLYLVWLVLEIFDIQEINKKILVLALCALALLPTAFSPAISGALLVLLLSVRVNYKTGAAIGLLALVYFVGQYYYDLTFTLLVKSGIMFASGLLFLLCYRLLPKTPSAHETV